MKIFKVTEDCKLKDFTSSVYPQGAFCLAALLRAKDIKVNGVRTDKNLSLKRGDVVEYYTGKVQESMPSHKLVYGDENIYVADKLSGVSYEGLLNELSASGKFFGVHRLDTNTQGLIIFAKNEEAEGELLKAFKERNVEKTYIALCKNNFKKREETLTAYLVKNAANSTVKVYDDKLYGGVEIITEYRVLEDRGELALVRVTLHTGKTHQIRAHMAHIGCPVLGDGKYGDGALNKKYNAKRQRLVSKTLAFNTAGILSYLKGKKFTSGFEL